MLLSSINEHLPKLLTQCEGSSLAPNWLRLKEISASKVEVSWQDMVDVSSNQLVMFQSPQNTQVYNKVVSQGQTSAVIRGLNPGSQFYARVASNRAHWESTTLNNIDEQAGNFTDA